MGSPGNGSRVTDLDPRRGAAVAHIHLASAAMVDARPDGLAQPFAIGHLAVVNLLEQTLWMIPINPRLAMGLRKQLQDLLDAAGVVDPTSRSESETP